MSCIGSQENHCRKKTLTSQYLHILHQYSGLAIEVTRYCTVRYSKYTKNAVLCTVQLARFFYDKLSHTLLSTLLPLYRAKIFQA